MTTCIFGGINLLIQPKNKSEIVIHNIEAERVFSIDYLIDIVQKRREKAIIIEFDGGIDREKLLDLCWRAKMSIFGICQIIIYDPYELSEEYYDSNVIVCRNILQLQKVVSEIMGVNTSTYWNSLLTEEEKAELAVKIIKEDRPTIKENISQDFDLEEIDIPFDAVEQDESIQLDDDNVLRLESIFTEDEEEEIEYTSRDLEQKKDILEYLHNELSEANAKIREFISTIALISGERDIYKEESDKIKEVYTDNKKKLDENIEKLSIVQEELRKYIEENKRLNSVISSNEIALEKLTIERDKLKEELDGVVKEYKSIEKEYKQMKNNYDYFISDRWNTLEEVNYNFTVASKELKEAYSVLEDLQQKYDEVSSELSKLKADYNEVVSRDKGVLNDEYIEQLENDLELARIEAEELRKKNKSLERQLKILEANSVKTEYDDIETTRKRPRRVERIEYDEEIPYQIPVESVKRPRGVIEENREERRPTIDRRVIDRKIKEFADERTVLTCDYRGRGKIIAIGGSGASGVTTLAVSLAKALTMQKISNRLLIMDLDTGKPRVNKLLEVSPNIPEAKFIKQQIKQTSFGIVLEKGVDMFVNDGGYFVSLGKNRDSSIEYFSGLYTRNGLDKIYEIDFSTLFTHLGNMFDTIVVDLGALNDDVQVNLAQMIFKIAYKNIFVTLKSNADVDMIREVLEDNGVRIRNSIWVLNKVNDTSVSNRIVEMTKGAEVILIPEVKLPGAYPTLDMAAITRERVVEITEKFI